MENQTVPISLVRTCRQANKWDWAKQIATISVRTGLEVIQQVQQQKPVTKRDWRLQALYEIGLPVCDFATFMINKDLCAPIA